MKPTSIAQFIRYKKQQKGSTIEGVDGNPLKDVFGSVIHATGTWKAPINVKQFNSSISAIHEAYEQNGPYEGRCEACLLSREWKGCLTHFRAPRLISRGCPVYAQDVKAEKRMNNKEAQTYVASGTEPLTPFQVLKVRNLLLSTNQVQDFQLFVMILMSIRLFLRSEEVSGEKIYTGESKPRPTGIKSDSFDFGLSGVKNGVLDTLALRVNGKTDKEIITLSLNREVTNPLLCPILHLQAYIYLIGWKGGHLFPDEQELANPPSDGIK